MVLPEFLQIGLPNDLRGAKSFPLYKRIGLTAGILIQTFSSKAQFIWFLTSTFIFLIYNPNIFLLLLYLVNLAGIRHLDDALAYFCNGGHLLIYLQFL